MLYVMEMTYLFLVSWSMLREPEYIQETVSRYILHRHSHQRLKRVIADYTKKLASSLHVIGLINIQFIAYNDEVYVIEVNPRSSRTVPYISKVTGIPIVDLATQCYHR